MIFAVLKVSVSFMEKKADLILIYLGEKKLIDQEVSILSLSAAIKKIFDESN